MNHSYLQPTEGSTAQAQQNQAFRTAKANLFASSASEVGEIYPAQYRDLLREIYHSPSYQLIRLFKRMNWKLRHRPKKPYYYPNSKELCLQEAVKILNSPMWSLLAPLHAVYLLIRKCK